MDEEQEPEVRDDQELKSDKQYWMRKFAINGFYAACIELIVLTYIFVFAPQETTAAISGASEIFITGLFGFFALTGAFMGIEYKMNMSK